MMRIVLTAAALLFGGLMPGCLSICGSPWEGSFQWNDSRIYQTFPAEGERNGYEVEWREPSDDPRIVHSSKRAEKESGQRKWFLGARDSNEISWYYQHAGGSAVSDSELREMLNATFKDLGLGLALPSAQGATPITGRAPC